MFGEFALQFVLNNIIIVGVFAVVLLTTFKLIMQFSKGIYNHKEKYD